MTDPLPTFPPSHWEAYRLTNLASKGDMWEPTPPVKRMTHAQKCTLLRKWVRAFRDGEVRVPFPEFKVEGHPVYWTPAWEQGDGSFVRVQDQMAQEADGERPVAGEGEG